MYNTTQFTYDKETKTFGACASDLQFPYFNWPKTIMLKSAKTGKVVTCVAMHDTATNDMDNELLYRTYEPISIETVTFRIEVHND